MISIPRVFAVTGGLIVAGVLAGGFAAGCALALSALLHGDWRSAFDAQLWRVSGLVGAVIGAVAAPLTSWLFLRHVPLGRLIVETTLGTVLTGGIGFALSLNPFIAAPVGFLAAAVRLAVVTPAKRPSQTLPPEG